MIKILAGGKKSADWVLTACREYEKRLHKPYIIDWQFLPEEKLAQVLTDWPFSGSDFVIIADERGQNLSSPELAQVLATNFAHSKQIIIIIGGAYGIEAATRARADLVWSFSRLVLPHGLARVLVTEQIYRSQEINLGGKYHHE